jgi:hypothetical protein
MSASATTNAMHPDLDATSSIYFRRDQTLKKILLAVAAAVVLVLPAVASAQEAMSDKEACGTIEEKAAQGLCMSYCEALNCDDPGKRTNNIACQQVLKNFRFKSGLTWPVCVDKDMDTIRDENDNCPEAANIGQSDKDNDAIGDACDVCPEDAGNDVDNDGICAAVDICPDDPTNSCGIKITKAGEAYGHHGTCSGWNGCGDAATCALWACEINGYYTLISYGEDKPCTQFQNCHLFRRQGNIQWNWGNICGVFGVTDIVCR